MAGDGEQPAQAFTGGIHLQPAGAEPPGGLLCSGHFVYRTFSVMCIFIFTHILSKDALLSSMFKS